MAEAFQRWPCVRTLAIVGVEVSRLFVAFRLEQVVDFHYVPTRRLSCVSTPSSPHSVLLQTCGAASLWANYDQERPHAGSIAAPSRLPSKCRLVLKQLSNFHKFNALHTGYKYNVPKRRRFNGFHGV
ncbi:hypothetical protein JG688_00004717 [Phytophthora aleatoria]|uniref:Uncharacterized protein n=1 Tax=Phytophthora aleatoria TaxID=2496075 RepID=A0A8J5IWA2_9STRA|nr:hypothetical protein JG688_00004717 [Phytophthora aleatoria]